MAVNNRKLINDTIIIMSIPQAFRYPVLASYVSGRVTIVTNFQALGAML
jgi:hypothetical protein